MADELKSPEVTAAERLFASSRWRVQRAVALRPFFPRAALRGEPLKKAAKGLRAVYGRFLDAHGAVLAARILAKADSATRVRPLEDQERYAAWRIRQMRFCRQAFWWEPKGNLFCTQGAVCPYCWARAAGDAWDGVARLLFPALPDGSHPPVAAYDLVAASREYVHDRNLKPFLAERLGDGKTPATLVAARKPEVYALNYAGAYECLAVRPRLIAGVPRMVTTIEQLFAVPAGASLGPHPDSPALPAPTVTRHPSPTCAKAASLVAAMCRFPGELIQPPEGMDAAQHRAGVDLYLTARDDRRLWSSYGGFRANAKPEKVVMDSDPPKKRGRPRKSPVADDLLDARPGGVPAPGDPLADVPY